MATRGKSPSIWIFGPQIHFHVSYLAVRDSELSGLNVMSGIIHYVAPFNQLVFDFAPLFAGRVVVGAFQ